MLKNKTTEIVGKIVGMLTPFSSEERQRIIRASLMLLGEVVIKDDDSKGGGDGEELVSLPGQAKIWIKQNGLSLDDLQQVFHLAEGGVTIIASEIPGKDQGQKTRNVYMLMGISRLLSDGVANFDDKSARAACETFGVYDSTNHAKYLKSKGNEFAGSKEKNWTLTVPGLKRGALLIKELNKNDK